MNHATNLKAAMLGGLIAIAAAVNGDKAYAGSEKLVVAGGCFWCVESDFESVKGVKEAVSGYTGGKTASADYKTVSTGKSGHYEAVEISFDTNRVTRDELLHHFFRSIDPTDAGGQFCDRGSTYRTAVFYANEEQKAAAETAKADAEAELGQKIVTKILPVSAFHEAEEYHQDYYKGKSFVLTRHGPKKQYEAYKFYRQSCGRDARVKELWGEAAPFADKHGS